MELSVKKIYFAGPSVFRLDALDFANQVKKTGLQYDIITLYPLDNIINTEGKTKYQISSEIFEANRAMIEACDYIVADLSEFRGKEPDSGTVWECGYGVGLGKKVFVYMSDKRNYIDRFDKQITLHEDYYVDENNTIIEDFDAPLNLMLTHSIANSEHIYSTYEEVFEAIALLPS